MGKIPVTTLLQVGEILTFTKRATQYNSTSYEAEPEEPDPTPSSPGGGGGGATGAQSRGRLLQEATPVQVALTGQLALFSDTLTSTRADIEKKESGAGAFLG